MAKKYSELRAKMSQSSRERSDLLSIELEKKMMPLQNLRISRGVSQEEMAKRLGHSQARISKMENTRNVSIQTLFKSVEALGGEVKIIARFPEGDCEIEFKE